MHLDNFPKLTERARRIHNVIQDLARCGRVKLAPVSDEAFEAAVGLLRRKIRRPFFAKHDTWLLTTLIENFEAFTHLGTHLELKIRGQRWTVWGMLVHPLGQLKPEVAQVLLANIGPCLVRLDLGQDRQPFVGMLENLKIKRSA